MLGQIAVAAFIADLPELHSVCNIKMHGPMPDLRDLVPRSELANVEDKFPRRTQQQIIKVRCCGAL